MSTHKTVVATLAAVGLLAACAAQNETVMPTRGPNLGRTPTAQEIRAADISIPPSGEGLPAGSGDAKQGAVVYAAKCQSCHGEKGMGKPVHQPAAPRIIFNHGNSFSIYDLRF